MSYILYFVAIILAIVSIILSVSVNSTFNKLSKTQSLSGLTGREAAERILSYAGITDVAIGRVSGSLTDHYDPTGKALNLSQGVYDGRSVAAIAIAAHECGHAIQHHTGYKALLIRNKLVPLANLGSTLGIWIFIIGMVLTFFSSTLIMDIGIVLFAFAVLFHVLTLPVELNASHRALTIIENKGLVMSSEMPKARKMLRVAALTYVAAAAQSVIQLLRLIAIRNRD